MATYYITAHIKIDDNNNIDVEILDIVNNNILTTLIKDNISLNDFYMNFAIDDNHNIMFDEVVDTTLMRKVDDHFFSIAPVSNPVSASPASNTALPASNTAPAPAPASNTAHAPAPASASNTANTALPASASANTALPAPAPAQPTKLATFIKLVIDHLNTAYASPAPKQFITSDEFNKLTDENNKFVDNMGPIQEKLTTFKNTQTINHSIDMQKYEQIYVTSDIHADVRKFLQLLIKEEIISIDNQFDPYNTELGTDFIDTIKFVKPKTLLIILGDLIDGKRINSVDDKVGNFEILLHVILFNMRISAKSMNSDVLFTLGNHDLENIYGRADLMDDYAHSINYFGDYANYKKNIAIALRPFYDLSPYIMLNLQQKNLTKYIGIHAGIHDSSDATNMLPDLEKMQQEINSKGLRNILTNQDNTDLSIDAKNTLVKPNRDGGDGGLWTRGYAEGSVICDNIKIDDVTILVGHCPTSRYLNNHLNKDAVGNYDNCLNKKPEAGKKGCALAICPDTSSNGRPKVILVDTMMSCAFYKGDYDNKNRNHEFILLKNEQIYRKPAGENEILVWDPKTVIPVPTPVPTPLQHILETNPELNNKKTYFIKSTKNP